MCLLVSLFTLFYLILENMSTNVKQFRFPCYILHFVTLCIIGCHLLNLIIYLVEPNFANWKLGICGFMRQRQGRKLWEFNTLIENLFFKFFVKFQSNWETLIKKIFPWDFINLHFQKKKKVSGLVLYKICLTLNLKIMLLPKRYFHIMKRFR